MQKADFKEGLLTSVEEEQRPKTASFSQFDGLHRTVRPVFPFSKAPVNCPVCAASGNIKVQREKRDSRTRGG